MRLSFQMSNGKSVVTLFVSLPLLCLLNGCRQDPDTVQISPAPAAANSQSASSISPVKTFKGHSDMILSLAFARDGKTLATASADRTVKLWDVETGKVMQTMTGHSLIVWSVAISPDGKTLASGGNDGSMRIWDAQSGQPLHVIMQGPVVNTVAFSPDGKLIASGRRTGHSTSVDSAAADATLNVWNAGSGKLVRAFTSPAPFPVQAVAFSPDGKLLLSGGIDKTLRLWDVQTGRLQLTFPGYSGKGKGQHGVINRVAFSPDGTLVASGGWDEVGTVWIWNVQTGALLHTLRGTSGSVSGLAFSPDGKTVAATTRSQVQLWNTQTGKLQKSWQEKNGIQSLAFTPDGKHLATGGREADNGIIKFWLVK